MQEDLSLRAHRRTYPRHLIWRREQLVRAETTARWLSHDIVWEKAWKPDPWMDSLEIRIKWRRAMRARHRAC